MAKIASVTIDRGFDSKLKPSCGSLLQEAESLALLGFPRAAAVIGRSAIEVLLASACRAANVWPVRPKFSRGRSRDFIGALLETSLIDRDRAKRLYLAIEIGSRAAHAKPITTSRAFVVIEIAHETHEFVRWLRRERVIDAHLETGTEPPTDVLAEIDNEAIGVRVMLGTTC